MDQNEKKQIEHHKQLEFCKTRPAYRQGKKLTAVKVYTVNSESQHLFIYGVPQINLRPEVKNLCSKYGQVLSVHVVSDYETERFTECYHVQYSRIQSARIAKRILDNKSFYGGVLHVCYAPECESLNETKTKLVQRKRDVLNRLHIPETNNARRNVDVQEKVHEQSSYLHVTDSNAYEIYHENDPILKETEHRKRKLDKSQTEIDCIPKKSCTSSSSHGLNRTLIPTQVIVPKKQIMFRKNINNIVK